MKFDFVKDYLLEAEEKGLKRFLRPIIRISARECIVAGKTCIDFSSNNYLGLADHPKLKEESDRWTSKYGTGSSASRLITGTFTEYLALEERIAAWKQKESALIFGSGYLANLGIIQSLADGETAIFADKLNHASLNAGCLISGAGFHRYPHRDMLNLGKQLAKFADSKRKIIASDTVFSMDGDIADISSLTEIAEKNDAILYLDDAHATGVFGDMGQGLAWGNTADICMGTFSKAMGSYGAYAACSREFRDYLVNRCQSFIYTTALPPSVYGAISAAVELVKSVEFQEIRENLLAKSADFACEIRGMGFDTGGTKSPIIPVIIGDTNRTVEFSKYLFSEGFLALPIRPPTVPRGAARLRISLNAAHTENDTERFLDCLDKAKTKLL